jgi:hypothetical protein
MTARKRHLFAGRAICQEPVDSKVNKVDLRRSEEDEASELLRWIGVTRHRQAGCSRNASGSRKRGNNVVKETIFVLTRTLYG